MQALRVEIKMSDVAIVKFQSRSFASRVLYDTIVSNDYHGKTHRVIQPWYCKEFKEMLLQHKNKESLGSQILY